MSERIISEKIMSEKNMSRKNMCEKIMSDAYLKPDNLLNELEGRKQQLQYIYNILQKEAQREPEGSLRISKKGKVYQYYFVENEHEERGKYISKKHMKRIKSLAQKDYNKKVRKELEREINVIDGMIKKYNPGAIEDIFDRSSPGRQVLINPIYMPDEMFAQIWSDEEYEGLPLIDDAASFITKRGEKVRSKTEMIIANRLNDAGIMYRYEYPIKLKSGMVVHPDFLCLNMTTRKEVVWEHFGMVDNYEYATNMIRKINGYLHSGYVWGETFIASFEGSRTPVDMKVIDRMMQDYLK